MTSLHIDVDEDDVDLDRGGYCVTGCCC